jgi:hypothetical protein
MGAAPAITVGVAWACLVAWTVTNYFGVIFILWWTCFWPCLF